MASIAASTPLRGTAVRLSFAAQWPVYAGLALLVLLMRGIEFGNPVAEMDDQLYSFIGGRMLSGELPYIDWWDRKPFGLFALFALAHALGGPGPLAYQLLAAASTLAGAILTHTLARPLTTHSGALIAGAFYVVLMSLYSGSSAQSEAFHVPLMLLMAWLVRDPGYPHAAHNASLAMAIGGLALQIKYTVLPQCVFFGCWALWGQFSRGAGAAFLLRNALIYAALGIAPTALVGAFYWAIGGWEAFWFANFVSFFLREGAFATRFYPRLVIWLLPLGTLLAAGLFIASRVEAPLDRRGYRFYALWLIAALVTVFMPRTIYPFYLAALVPCVALLAIPLFDRRSLIALTVPLLILAYLINLSSLGANYHRASNERRDIVRFAQAIAPYVDATNSCLLVFDGPTALYRLAGACAPSRIVYPDHLNSALETPALEVAQTAELARILATTPAVIVTANEPVVRQNPSSLRLVNDALRKDYRPFAEMGLQRRTITAWSHR